ncbi:unnamed protein product, partial [Pylaiella littoralis]
RFPGFQSIAAGTNLLARCKQSGCLLELYKKHESARKQGTRGAEGKSDAAPQPALERRSRTGHARQTPAT